MPSSWPSSPSWSSWRSSSCSPPSPTPSTTSAAACRLTRRRLTHQQDGGAAAAPPSCCLYRFAFGTLDCLLNEMWQGIDAQEDVNQEAAFRIIAPAGQTWYGRTDG